MHGVVATQGDVPVSVLFDDSGDSVVLVSEHGCDVQERADVDSSIEEFVFCGSFDHLTAPERSFLLCHGHLLAGEDTKR